MPELIITISSAAKGYTDLIIGNAIGSNLCNILLILGVVSIIKPMKIEETIGNIHVPIAFFVTILVLLIGNGILGFNVNSISKIEGTILLILFAFYFYYPIHIEIKDIVKSKKKRESKDQKRISIFTSLIFIILGIILLKIGGDYVVDNCVSIAQTFGISERIIGLTIIAVGTALPEFITSIIATFKGGTDMAIGNLVGSCVLNLFLILGIGAVIQPLDFSLTFNTEFLISAISLCFIFLFNHLGTKGKITREKGILLVLTYCAYLISILLY